MRVPIHILPSGFLLTGMHMHVCRCYRFTSGPILLLMLVVETASGPGQRVRTRCIKDLMQALPPRV